MRTAFGVWLACGAFLTPTLSAQSVSTSAPPSRFGLAGGLLKDPFASGAQIRGFAYLAREDRPITFRADITAGWLPLQTIRTDQRAWREEALALTLGASTLFQLRSKSRVTPYAIVGYRVEQGWVRNAITSLAPSGQLAPMASAWRPTGLQGALGAGVGVRIRVGRQVFHVEAMSYQKQLNISIGLRVPF